MHTYSMFLFLFYSKSAYIDSNKSLQFTGIGPYMIPSALNKTQKLSH